MIQELQRTNESFTIGIVNLPIVLFNDRPKKYKVFKKDTNRYHDKYAVIPDLRYPFFEYDTRGEYDREAIETILHSYRRLKLPVYSHRTMRGWHFISLVALHKDYYSEWIKPLMKFNPKCPMVTLRIKPNKWVGEKEIWNDGMIICNDASEVAIKQLEQFKTWIERQHIGLLGLKYYIVRYKMTGELGNL